MVTQAVAGRQQDNAKPGLHQQTGFRLARERIFRNPGK
jgi:hypothetical protein